MQAILDFLEGFVETITSVVDFVIGFFDDIVYLIAITGQVLLQIPAYFSFLPSEIVSLLVVLFSLVVLYKILGREG